MGMSSPALQTIYLFSSNGLSRKSPSVPRELLPGRSTSDKPIARSFTAELSGRKTANPCNGGKIRVPIGLVGPFDLS
jgi:hypothetical protein